MARFVKRHPGIPNDTEPVELSDEEKLEILDVIPKPIAGDNYSAAIGRIAIIGSVLSLFKGKLTSAPGAKDRLKEIILRTFEAAKAQPGDPIGGYTTDAFSATASQIALDAFKTIGNTGIDQSVQAFDTLLYTVKERNDPKMTIHFNTLGITRDDVIEMRATIEERTVLDFVRFENKRPKIEIGGYFDPMKTKTTPDAPYGERRYLLKEKKIFSPEWWYGPHLQHLRHYTTHILRIHLDPQLLFEHRVSIHDVCHAIEKASERTKPEANTVYVVPSPFSTGIIDVHPLLDISEASLAKYDNASLHAVNFPVLQFFTSILRPLLSQIRIKGIPRIKKLMPMTVSFLGMFKNTVRLTQEILDKNRALAKLIQKDAKLKEEDERRGEIEHYYIINLDRKYMYASIIDIDKIEEFLKTCGIKIISRRQNIMRSQIVKVLKSEFPDINDNLPGDYDFLTVFSPEGEPIRAINASGVSTDYIYAMTLGSNIREINRLPWVDSRRTFSNEFHVTSQVYGCEASRMYYIYELLEVLKRITRISPRNILLLADLVYSKGLPLGVTSTGEAGRGTRGLGQGVIDRFVSSMFNAAIYGTKEKATSFSISIVIGRHVPVGKYSLENVNFWEKYLGEVQKEYNIKYRLNEEEPENQDPVVADVSSILDKIELVKVEPEKEQEEEDRRSWPEPDIVDVEDLDFEIGDDVVEQPPFLGDVEKYLPAIRKAYNKLSANEKMERTDNYHLVRFLDAKVKTMMRFGGGNPDETYLFNRMKADGFVELPDDEKVETVDFVYYGKNPKLNVKDIRSWSDVAQKKIFLLSSLDRGADTGNDIINNKLKMAINLREKNPALAKRYLPAFVEISNEKVQSIPEDWDPDGIYIIRPVGVENYSGFGIIRVAGRDNIIPEWTKRWKQVEGNRKKRIVGTQGTIVSEYILRPLLLNVADPATSRTEYRKFHMRCIMTIAVGPEVKNGYSVSIWDKADIMTAAKPYAEDDFDNDEIHDTHRKGTPFVISFPRDLHMIKNFEQYGKSSEVIWGEIYAQIVEVLNAAAESVRKEMAVYSNSRNAYEVYGTDLMLTQDLQVKLIEINTRPGFFMRETYKIPPWVNVETNVHPVSYENLIDDYFGWMYDKVVEPIMTNYNPTLMNPETIKTAKMQVVQSRRNKRSIKNDNEDKEEIEIPNWIEAVNSYDKPEVEIVKLSRLNRIYDNPKIYDNLLSFLSSMRARR